MLDAGQVGATREEKVSVKKKKNEDSSVAEEGLPQLW